MEILNASKPMPQRKWLVIYTRPRWEKKVDQTLKMQGIISYCPLRKEKHQWADRVKEIETPLFNSYIFVYVDPWEELKVRMTNGFINFVYYMGKPAIIRESVIENIKNIILVFPQAEILNMRGIAVGDLVRIKDGLMREKEGQVVKIQGKNVLMLIESLNCMMITTVAVGNLVPVN
ncbi:UpxY family transcription antiterminator [Pedobacter sp. MC2016-24]|uniref:UpxY family transcription antiterminator n=1 Tax=Pedobacter sp. MC2016-24 TaxID=2780090 RepID=UPI001882209C|nr:UpxY family transcription antiterminator [Pedobacter sp. MC2016-24]MBE9601648.1 UpxY family transcription antiterminator [Pedobacter sp. MC2016-24]